MAMRIPVVSHNGTRAGYATDPSANKTTDSLIDTSVFEVPGMAIDKVDAIYRKSINTSLSTDASSWKNFTQGKTLAGNVVSIGEPPVRSLPYPCKPTADSGRRLSASSTYSYGLCTHTANVREVHPAKTLGTSL